MAELRRVPSRKEPVTPRVGVDPVKLWEDMKSQYDEPKWWHVAEKHIRSEVPRLVTECRERPESYSVYIFISSTFSDMHCERDQLVRYVFPALQEWCEKEGLSLQICPLDLRWGVVGSHAQTFEICMELVQRCHEQNGIAYFLGLLGDRYGFIPEVSEIGADIRSRFCLLPGMSITAAEMYTGAIWDRNPNAIFLERSSDAICESTVSKVTEAANVTAIINDYVDKDAEKQSLEKLKEHIRRTHKEQTFVYTCDVVGMLEDQPGKLNLDNFRLVADGKPLEACVLEFFKDRIVKQYPRCNDNVGNLSPFEIQRKHHRAFMLQRCSLVLGRETELQEMLDYIDEDRSPGEYVPTLAVTGPAGVGKSSLLAKLGSECATDRRKQSIKLVTHFVGVASGSTTLDGLLARLWYECLDCQYSHVPTDLAQLRFCLENIVFKQASEMLEEGHRLVVILDGLNQLDDEHEALNLRWLPKAVPHNVRLIVSSITTDCRVDECISALRENGVRKATELPIEAHNTENRKRVIKDYLARYGKTLDDEQMNIVVGKADSGLPLWLTFACEELRLHGRFPTFNKKLIELDDTLPKIIDRSIRNSIECLAENGELIAAALSLIGVTRFGLTEIELRILLAASRKNTKASCSYALSSELWYTVWLELRKYVRPIRSAFCEYDFYHRAICKSVNRVLLGNKATRQFWHQRLADYFEESTSWICYVRRGCRPLSAMRRKALNLPWQLLELKDYVKLRKVLLNYEIFEELDTDKDRLFLVDSYLKVVGERNNVLIVRDYEDALKSEWAATWFPEMAEGPNENDGIIRQWASRVINFSSQRSETDGAAKNMLDRYTVYPVSIDCPQRTWSPATVGSNYDFIELGFEKAVFVTGISIYETWHAGAVSSISIRDPEGNWRAVFTASHVQCLMRARPFSPALQTDFDFPTDAVRIHLDQTACAFSGECAQLDAIALFGRLPQAGLSEAPPQPAPVPAKADVTGAPVLKRQFASRVIAFSGQRHDDGFAAHRLVGKPAFDYPRDALVWQRRYAACAWCPRYDQQQTKTAAFVELEFEESMYVAAVEIFMLRTSGAGYVSRVALLGNDADATCWHSVYEAGPEPVRNAWQAWRFVPTITLASQSNRMTKAVRIEVCEVFGVYPQLDAVALFGYSTKPTEEQRNQTAAKVVASYYANHPLFEDEMDEETSRFESLFPSLSNYQKTKWLDASVKCARFFVELDTLAFARKSLAKLGNRIYANDYHEVDHSYGLLHENIERVVKWFHRIASMSGSNLHCALLVAACNWSLIEHVDSAIDLLETRNGDDDRRALVALYAAKGGLIKDDDKRMRDCFEKALRLVIAEFHCFHSARADTHGQYAQALYAMHSERRNGVEFLQEAAYHLRKELEIREALFGADHPCTLRVVDWNVRVLKKLSRHAEVEALKTKFPIPYGIRAIRNASMQLSKRRTCSSNSECSAID